MNTEASLPSSTTNLLEVKDLRVYYETPGGDVLAVDSIDFELKKGETLGLVGESGCGKSTAAMGILQLVHPPGRIVSGEVRLQGENLLTLPEGEMRQLRWTKLALIPQGAMNSLNPTMKIYRQIQDVILTHQTTGADKPDADQIKNRILELLRMVGLPERIYQMYPHELSGGMKQRIVIAMALLLKPKFVIADEPTTALDVLIQAQIVNLLK
ncbi:MAG: ABC transporter ATP-binding protein, partial [Candidatus Poribacteria bacterium]|nr:ABC transporter ATP-binding protein [Candidatus Poribacteria bacterium]